MASEISIQVQLKATKAAVNVSRQITNAAITMAGTHAHGLAVTVPYHATDGAAIPLGNVSASGLGMALLYLPSTATYAVDIGTGTTTFVPLLTLAIGEAMLLRFKANAAPTWRAITEAQVAELILLEA